MMEMEIIGGSRADIKFSFCLAFGHCAYVWVRLC